MLNGPITAPKPMVRVVRKEVGEKTYVNVEIAITRGERTHALLLHPTDIAGLIDDLRFAQPEALQALDDVVAEARARRPVRDEKPQRTWEPREPKPTSRTLGGPGKTAREAQKVKDGKVRNPTNVGNPSVKGTGGKN